VTTEAEVDAFLRKVQEEPEETLLAYSVLFENMAPGEGPDVAWKGVSEEESHSMRAAIRMGLVSSNFRRWVADYPDEFVPDGGDYMITLTGLGTEKLLRINETYFQKAKKQITANLPTIITSILISLVGAWAINFWGPANKIHPVVTESPSRNHSDDQ